MADIKQELDVCGGKDERLKVTHTWSTDVSMSSSNGSFVPDEQLHTNGRRCWSSTSAVCQSAEVDRSVLSSEQFWSSFCYCRPVDLEFAIHH